MKKPMIPTDRPALETGGSGIYSETTSRLARLFYEELVHAGVGIEEWDALGDFERDAYREAIDGLLLSWDLLERARAELPDQPREVCPFGSACVSSVDATWSLTPTMMMV